MTPVGGRRGAQLYSAGVCLQQPLLPGKRASMCLKLCAIICDVSGGVDRAHHTTAAANRRGATLRFRPLTPQTLETGELILLESTQTSIVFDELNKRSHISIVRPKVDQKLIASLAPVNTAPPPLCPPELDAHAIAMQLEVYTRIFEKRVTQNQP